MLILFCLKSCRALHFIHSESKTPNSGLYGPGCLPTSSPVLSCLPLLTPLWMHWPSCQALGIPGVLQSGSLSGMPFSYLSAWLTPSLPASLGSTPTFSISSSHSSLFNMKTHLLISKISLVFNFLLFIVFIMSSHTT